MRSSRLLQILLLLQTRRQLTARELAEELEVSLRTIYRDVEALAAAGVPVYADQGRAGGYRLVDGYRTKLTGLNEGEAAALFLVGMPGPAAALGLTEQTSAAELKLLAALAPDQRDRAGRLKNRFHLDMPAWYRDAEDSPYLSSVASAVMEDRRIKVLYRRWEAPREVERTLEPYGLVLKNGSWYVVAATKGGVRTYRVSNILQLAPTDEAFTRPGDFDLAGFWQAHLDRFEQQRFTGEALVRISAWLVARLSDLSAAPLLKAVADSGAEPDADGSVTVALPIESPGHAAQQLIRYGKALEVLEPPELRAELKRLAEEVSELYS
ncbi:helix-turn-helix transcriptional regulator [Kribbella sp. CA-294648]|uniref:helix-turn-helix transcriptional regulator n=1 Tax=Kribbella sp. CA-294648 TaxID=3239948 RepID=UPI003D947AAB